VYRMGREGGGACGGRQLREKRMDGSGRRGGVWVGGGGGGGGGGVTLGDGLMGGVRLA